MKHYPDISPERTISTLIYVQILRVLDRKAQFRQTVKVNLLKNLPFRTDSDRRVPSSLRLVPVTISTSGTTPATPCAESTSLTTSSSGTPG